MGTDASNHNGRRGCLQGSPRNLRDDPGAHGNGWTQGQMQTRASRHGIKAEAGRQGMARPEQAAVAKTGRHTQLAGLLSRSGGLWRECYSAGRSEGGLGPTLLSPPNLSPLPVSVHTHSLSLQKSNQFSPILFYFPFL